MKQKVGELKGGENLSRIQCACGSLWIAYGNKKVDAEERKKFIEKHKDHYVISFHIISQTWTITHTETELEQVFRLVHPLKMTIKLKGKEDLRLYFETSDQARLFKEFVEALIAGVKEKMRRKQR